MNAAAPYTLLWLGAGDGAHRLSAVATDDRGVQTSSDPGATSVALTLSGLRWELPNTGAVDFANCLCPLVVTDRTTAGGSPDTIYQVDVRFRGVVEKCTYLGGQNDGSAWQIGGLPDGSNFNVYKLEVSDPPQVFYVNAGASYDPQIYLLDFVEPIQVRGGATITLTGDSREGVEHSNYRHYVVPGIAPAPAPFDGQFVQMDVVSAGSDHALLVHVHPACALTPAGLVSWWPGEGDAGDLTGRHPGAALDGLAFTPGETGQGFTFAGRGESVRVPASPDLDLGAGAGLTVECWVKPSNLGAAIPVVEWNDEAGGFGSHLWLSETFGGGGPGSVFLNLADTAGNNHLLISPAGTVATDSFQHLAATYDQASGIGTLYLNGAVVAQAALGSFTPRTSYPFWIGHRPSGPQAGASFRGVIDEVCLYDHALTPAQIATLATTGKCSSGDNTAPVVDAGPDLAIPAGGTATLSGSVTDDGRPLRAGLTASWSTVSGPGTVSFAQPSAPVTTATFTAPGSYVLRLTASDTQLTGSDDVTVLVQASANLNQPPVVSAGPNASVAFPQPASLTGTATDDGLPGGPLALLWSKTSGPGAVTFGDPESAATSATFSLPGTYVLRLTASDSQLTGRGEVTIFAALRA